MTERTALVLGQRSVGSFPYNIEGILVAAGAEVENSAFQHDLAAKTVEIVARVTVTFRERFMDMFARELFEDRFVTFRTVFLFFIAGPCLWTQAAEQKPSKSA
jgi:hypothetical protein